MIKRFFNKIREPGFSGVAILIIIMAYVSAIGFELAILDIATVHLPFSWMWIPYTICWIFVLVTVLLIAKADKEKYTVIGDCGFGVKEVQNELEGCNIIMIIWSAVMGGFIAYLIPREGDLPRILVVLFAAWMLIVAICFGYYLNPGNPSGDPQNRPMVDMRAGGF